MVVRRRLCGEAAGRGSTHQRAQLGVGLRAVVGNAPALGVHVGNDVALEQRGQPLVRGGERPGGVVGGEASRIRRGGPGVVVDAHHRVGPGQIGALVPGGHVIVGTLEGEHSPVDIGRPQT